MQLNLFNFNNYYNRIIDKKETLAEYSELVASLSSGMNFNSNDGVSTSHVFNISEAEAEKSNYLIVCTDNGASIVSRWFITEMRRTRGGQYVATLRRDVISDNLEAVLNADVFIEKATLKKGNPLIFNKEGMTFNQIKQSENLLFDSTNSPWIIMYINNNWDSQKTISVSSNTVPVIQESLASITTKLNNKVYLIDDYDHVVNLSVKCLAKNNNFVRIDAYSDGYTEFEDESFTEGNYIKTTKTVSSAVSSVHSIVEDNVDTFRTLFTGYDLDPGDLLSKYNGKYVDDDGTIKILRVTRTKEVTNNVIFDLTTPGSIQNYFLAEGFTIPANVTPYLDISAPTYRYQLTVEDAGIGSISVTLDSSSIPSLLDAPYRMLCMRFNENNMRMAIKINTELGGQEGYIYDMQLLPYCPITEIREREAIGLGFKIAITDSQDTIDYIYIAQKSSFSFEIPYNIPSLDPKIENECELWRLCSPNGNGMFEFSVAKNGGVESFNVDCTYRPIDPYIHINPNFSGLYGQDFNDFRGLILNGDFSLPAVTDAWIQYQIQNKNYENIFNREIQSLDLNNKIQKQKDVFGAIVGTATGGTAGMLAGSKLGPAGAIAGAAIGTVASGIGGILDVQRNETLRDDAKDLKTDLYNYNLGNIQALPNSISKTGCLTNNNKLVPYLEYYTCKEEEKEALRKKLYFNGMTVMVVGKIADYLQNEKSFIQGQLIRTNAIGDFHMVNAIADEISKGVFI